MKVAILGGGFTGLTAGLRLLNKGHSVCIFEKSERLGGLAGGFKLEKWDWSLEYHYHHLFTSDYFALSLIKEIGKKNEIIFNKPQTSLYHSLFKEENKIKETLYHFDSAVDLLKFPHLAFLSRLRAGLVLFYLKYCASYRELEKITADQWLNKYFGKDAYQILWEPLLVKKFGEEAKNISLAWFWARIYKRSKALGYIKGGFQNFADQIGNEIEKRKGDILLKTEVSNLLKINDRIIVQTTNGKKETFDKVISTLPSSVFLRIAPSLPLDYSNRLSSIKHLDSLNLVLVLRNRFFKDSTYWLNINDLNIPFLALVEHTNFMEKKNYDNKCILYIGNYLNKDNVFFKKSKEELLDLYDKYLRLFNPDYKNNLEDYYLFRGNEAQPIIKTNYSRIKPDFNTPIENLWLANMDMVYPWDRGVNYAIELGEKIAEIVSS